MLTELFRNISGDKTEKLKNCFFMERSLPEILMEKTVFQFFSFAYGSIPEHFRRQNWKTEKLFFPERSRERFSIKKQFFSFFSFAYGTLPEHFRRQNWKTEKLFFCGESLPGSLWKKQFFSFSVLKNWKTVFLRKSLPGFRKFFSFAYGTLPETSWKTEKLKNCFFMENLSLDLSGKNQFFSFSVLLTEVFRNMPHFLVLQFMSYIFIYELDMWPPKRSLPNLEVKMCLKHCKNQCFFEKRRFWGGATIYIYT